MTTPRETSAPGTARARLTLDQRYALLRLVCGDVLCFRLGRPFLLSTSNETDRIPLATAQSLIRRGYVCAYDLSGVLIHVYMLTAAGRAALASAQARSAPATTTGGGTASSPRGWNHDCI